MFYFNILIRAVQSTSDDIIEEKTQMLEERLWLYAVGSGLAGAIPIPGLGVALDAGIIAHMAMDQKEVFGLTDSHMKDYARELGITVDELLEKVPSAKGLLSKPEEWLKTLVQGASFLAGNFAEEGLKLVPLLGSVLAGMHHDV